MIVDDEMQERFRDFYDVDGIRKAADIVADLLPVIVDAVKEQTKTKRPRDPVRSIGCRPVTKSRKPQIIRTGCRHK